PVARVLSPLTQSISRMVATTRRGLAVAPDEAGGEANEAANADIDTAAEEGLIPGEERPVLPSIVDFGHTLGRKVVAPRPDVLAVRESATVGDVRALFREQEYSRFPVFKDSLDNITGFVFVKDLLTLTTDDDGLPVAGLLRPAVFVPETKRVPELLK